MIVYFCLFCFSTEINWLKINQLHIYYRIDQFLSRLYRNKKFRTLTFFNSQNFYISEYFCIFAQKLKIQKHEQTVIT